MKNVIASTAGTTTANQTMLSVVSTLLPPAVDESDLRVLCRYQLCQGKPDDQLYKPCTSKFPDIFQDLNPPIIGLPSRVALTTIFAIILAVAVMGNILVILTFVFNRHMRSVTNVFIFSLAVSDLVATVTRIPLNIGMVVAAFWPFSTFGCKLLPSITNFAVACSSLTLCCIAFDRYYAIVHPLKLKFVQTSGRATVLQAIVWIVSASLSIPYAFLYDISDVCKDNDDMHKYVCVMSKDMDGVTRAFNILLLFLFCATFACMTGMYTVVCFKLWFKRPIGTGVQKANDVRLGIKRKVVKMLITVVMLFLVCWSPIMSFNEYADEHRLKMSAVSLNWRAYLNGLSLSSCCWNPIVYAFMNEKFRKAFKTLLTCRKNYVYPINIRRMRADVNHASTESRKTTSQLEMPGLAAAGSKQTTQTNMQLGSTC